MWAIHVCTDQRSGHMKSSLDNSRNFFLFLYQDLQYRSLVCIMAGSLQINVYTKSTPQVMLLSIMPTTPFQAISGKRWGFELCKIQMHHQLLVETVKSQPSPYLKDGDLRGNWLLMFTLFYMHMITGQTSTYWASFVVKWTQMPHLFPKIAWEEVVVHNIDRCITLQTKFQ